MGDDEVQRLADDVVAGRRDLVLGVLSGEPALAAAVSVAAAQRLVERAAATSSQFGAVESVWPVAQDAVVAVAALAGADAARLAGALLRCCVYERVRDERDRLGQDGLRLILDHHGEVVEELLRRPLIESSTLAPAWPVNSFGSMRFIADALWEVAGPEGLRWMELFLDQSRGGSLSRSVPRWTAEDWTLRLDALRDRGPEHVYRLPFLMIDPDRPAPRAAAPALARFACSLHVAGQGLRRSLGGAADVLALYRTGDPEQDVELFWWGASDPDELMALLWLLEVAGPAGWRSLVVQAALARDLIDPSVARALHAEVERPLWADRDVPWVVTEVREHGVRETPRDLAALVGVGPLLLRTVVAVHPVHGRADAAVEVVADATAEPLDWRLAGEGLWVGRGGDGRPARAVQDFGVLQLDLAGASPPWFVHDRVPPEDDRDASSPLLAQIDADDLRHLAHSGASLRRQRHALREALHQRGVGEYASAVVLRHVRDGIALVTADVPARSRLGGTACLPADAPWPVLDDDLWSPALLAELALRELPTVEPLPGDGTLLVFQETETWGGEYDPLVGTRVYYVPEGEELRVSEPPGSVFFPLKHKALRGVAVPIPGESQLVVDALEFVDDRQQTIQAMDELMDPWWPEHWLLGASLDVQGPARLDVRHLLHGASAETRARFSSGALGGEGWTLLLQVNGDDQADIAIADGGSYYLYILADDLRQRRFDRVVAVIQSH